MTARDYAKICPTFWTGRTGRAITAEGETVTLVALYLLTSPHASPTGLYRLPVAYATEDTGLDRESYTAALGRLEAVGFLARDGDLVWIRRMGEYQIADEIKPRDGRRAWVEKALHPYRASPLYAHFFARYGIDGPWS